MHLAHSMSSSIGGGRHGRSSLLAASSVSSASQSLVAYDDHSAPSAPPSGSFFAAAFAAPRHLHLHAYDPQSRRVDYVEVKIGGHALDHKHIMEDAPRRPRGPLKKAVATTTQSNQSPAFEAHDKPVLVYAPVKIGGHAMDHVRFFNKGKPSRPLWGFAPVPLRGMYPEPPVRVVFPGTASLPKPLVVTDASVPRPLANLYDCSHCRRMRQSARVQLCCGHSLCASCLASDTLRHIVVEDNASLCLLECTQCADFVAMEAVVFSAERVLRVDHSSPTAVRTLRDLNSQSRSTNHKPTSLSTVSWKSGSAVAAIALVAGRLSLTPRQRKRASHADRDAAAAASMVAVLEEVAAASDMRLENGAVRWKKRIQGLQPPSKLLKYSFVRTLGVGNFAEVMLVRNRKGTLCVLKESDKLQEAVNEIGLLSKIRSPHVVRIAEYFVEEIGPRHFAYIEMEFCDRGDLLRLLQSDGAMDASTFDRVFRQLCLGLKEIHARGIIHRDLKPGNVLLTSEGLAKIADFGVSTCLESDLLTHHAAGTLAFMAPEVRRYFLGENVSYNTKADIWSLGALAVAMLSGNPEPRVATRVAEDVVEELVASHGISNHHAALLTRLLDAEPQRRPSLDELLELVPQTLNARL